jgi:hypothetical protein
VRARRLAEHLVDQPLLQLIVMGPRCLPAVPVGTVRRHPFAHHADQTVTQLALAAVRTKPASAPAVT